MQIVSWLSAQGFRSEKNRLFSKDIARDMLGNPYYVVYTLGESPPGLCCALSLLNGLRLDAERRYGFDIDYILLLTANLSYLRLYRIAYYWRRVWDSECIPGVGAHMCRQEMHRNVAKDLHTIFNAPDRFTAEAYLDKIVQKYTPPAPALADCLRKMSLKA